MTRPTLLITGGAGFIGSALVRAVVRGGRYSVVTLDKLTYAGNLDSLGETLTDPSHTFVQGDITDAEAVRSVFGSHHPAGVIHLAAESHVDRSIDGPGKFIRTNVLGTYTLLQEALRYWKGQEGAARDGFRLHHVSTDEVFGSLGESGAFSEETPYRPNSPYSASKASSDHLVRAWHHTYGLPTLMTNCSNNYGPYQFPEKLIPLMIQRGLSGESLPVYGTGANVRDWLYVEDHVDALMTVYERGRTGETYNVGGGAERRNIDVVRTLCQLLDELRPLPDGRSHAEQITFVADRPGHDLRYAIDASKITAELGWQPNETFESGLRRTVEWYLANAVWCARVQSGAYRGERLGLGGER